MDFQHRPTPCRPALVSLGTRNVRIPVPLKTKWLFNKFARRFIFLPEPEQKFLFRKHLNPTA
ncbi:hypothetical protein Pla52n_04550 [Stieleria varia]|uniref:Uncharacterized protein n=1 Tax=Stieleria varia TaxID=2528005 RepID=A0A5C6B989_9BACT|nr:hypothetical protein Pla52n_04550 [Stieleria varia]